MLKISLMRIRCRIWLAVAAAILVAANVSIAEDYFIAGPYTTRVDHESAQIIWVSPSGTEAGEVVIHLADEPDQKKRIRPQLSIPVFHDRSEGEMDHVRLLAEVENLRPSGEYSYRIECAAGKEKRSGGFMTAPAPGEDEVFDFIVISDTHGGHDAIAEAVKAQQPAFVVLTGDYAGGRGHDWGGWMSYFRSARPYLESAVHWPVTGGHDIRPARNYRAFFGFNDPDGDPADEDSAASNYSFRFGSLHYIILDSYYDFEQQLDWVEEELAGSDARWRFVSLHDSIFTVGSRGSLLRGLYRDFAEVFEKYGVDVVIFGHDHVYERSLPIGPTDGSPVHYITTNAAGNFRVVRPSPIVTGGIGRRVHCYTQFFIDGNRMRMETRTADGNLVDEFELVKDTNEGGYQTEIMEKTVDTDLALDIAHVYTGEGSGRYSRRDLMVEFADFPKAGETVEISLDVSSFPENSELVVYGNDDADGWRVPYSVFDASGESVKLEVVVPEGVIHGEGLLDPALELHANLRINGRQFEPVTVRPTLGTATVEMLQIKNIQERLELSALQYSDNLVPATGLDIPDSPQFTGGLRARGAHLFYTWIEDPDQPVKLTVTGGGISQSRYRDMGDFEIELYYAGDGEREPGERFAPVDPDAGSRQYLIGAEPVSSAPVRRTGEPTKIELNSPHQGLHIIHYDDRRDSTTLSWEEGMPLTFEASQLHNPSSFEGRRTKQQNDWDMVFYVPKGTESVDGHAGASRGSINYPDGEKAFDLTNYQGYFSISVEDGQDGAVWRLQGYRGSEIFFLSVPPYLARSARELLLPREIPEMDRE